MSGFSGGGRATWWALALALVGAGGCGSVGSSKDAGTGGAGGAGGADAAPDHASGGSGGTDGGPANADGGGDVAGDGGACALLASCAALHACDATLPSGNYMIAPDGTADGGASVLVHCDMDIGGGGWTVIYLADAVDLSSTTIAYTVPAQSLRDNAQEALIAFRNLNLNMVASDWASFGLPATWRAKNPLAVTPFEDLTVSASINGALPALAQLRYGTANFGSLCSDDWVTTSSYGRVCLQGTAAAFFSGFAIAGTDLCALSDQTYSVRACSDAIRFSIAVR